MNHSKTYLCVLLIAGGNGIAQAATPTLPQLNNYDVVLAFTDFPPSDPVALGDVLADYVDAGGRIVVATYGFSAPLPADFSIKGRIMNPGYSPLINVGVIGDVSGNLVAVAPGNPIFNGVDLPTLTYFHNNNFAHPGLDPGAELLATDGAGINMIARNNAGSVVGLNMFPAGNIFGNNGEFYELLNNSLTSLNPNADSLLIVHAEAGMGLSTARNELLALGDFLTIDEFDVASVPEGDSSAVLTGIGLLGLAGFMTKQRILAAQA